MPRPFNSERTVAVIALGMALAVHSTVAFGDASVPVESLAASAQNAASASGLKVARGDAPMTREPMLRNGVAPDKKQSGSAFALNGFVQAELARTVATPDHWSNMLTRVELGARGRFSEQVRWKFSARLDYDAVYDLYDFYPQDVRKDQRLNLLVRENYLDLEAGNWDFRLGRQHIVWGEVVGLFFADVVSAKDMRQFILPEFEILRIPQWAARAEYSGKAFHAELLWVPIASYDEIGKPGAEFFPVSAPAPPGFATLFRNEVRPAHTFANTNYGVRLSTLQNGWDVSGFYYRSMDASPTFHRQIVGGPQPAFIFEPRHDRIRQFGSTLAKGFGSVVLKGEAVYTRGRQFNVLRLSDDNGLVPQNTLDWVAGLDFALPAETRLNLQLFQRIFFDHDPDIIPRKHESGYSVLLNGKLTDWLEAQVLWISSLNRSDWLLRPRVDWNFERNWRLRAGVDIFNGPPLGLFGRFANRDRVYMELRYSF